MNWETMFAPRTQAMRRSAVRELLKVLGQPGMISFGGGLPAPELFPVAELREAAEVVLSKHAASALQYGQSEGLPELRAWLAERHACSAENVLIVSGSQQGLDLIGRVFLEPGDCVVTQNPTYLAMLLAWRPWEPCFVEPAAESGEGGLPRPARHGWNRALPNAKLVYVVPNFTNPAGTTLSLEERQQLARSGNLIVEDDPYGELRYEGEALPSILEMNREIVIHLGTVSKVLAPGLRIGWVIAPTPVIDKLALARQAADLQTSTFNQHLVLEVLQRGVLERQLPRLRAAYRERRDVMLQALQEHFPKEVTWTRPEGGMFLMVFLSEGMDASALLKDALREKVAFVPGEEFFFDGRGKSTMRLNFSNATPELIREGIRRLGKVISRATA